MQDNFQQLVNQINRNSYNKHRLIEDLHSILKRQLRHLDDPLVALKDPDR